jgi:hypothetical protein
MYGRLDSGPHVTRKQEDQQKFRRQEVSSLLQRENSRRLSALLSQTACTERPILPLVEEEFPIAYQR